MGSGFLKPARAALQREDDNLRPVSDPANGWPVSTLAGGTLQRALLAEQVSGPTPGGLAERQEDGTSVEVWLTAKGAAQVQHQKLPDKAAAARMKLYWTKRLDALGAVLTA